MTNDKLIIYTAITGDYPGPYQQPPAPKGTEYICYLDQSDERDTHGWRKVALTWWHEDACRRAKAPKIQPQQYHRSTYSLWIDGHIILRRPFGLKQAKEILGKADIAVYHHHQRQSIRQELDAVITQGKIDSDEQERAIQQLQRYLDAGYPDDHLSTCTAILRRHTAASAAFDALWWGEIQRGCRRDQLSFDYTAWRLGTRIKRLKGNVTDNPLWYAAKFTPQAADIWLAPTIQRRKHRAAVSM